MFYSKYSDYAPEQIITEKYEKVCEYLMNMVQDGQTKEIMKSWNENEKNIKNF